MHIPATLSKQPEYSNGEPKIQLLDERGLNASEAVAAP